MKHDWLLRYNPPREDFDYDNIATWQKVFIIDKHECPEKLDFDLKINALKKKYKMKDEYIRLDAIISLTK